MLKVLLFSSSLSLFLLILFLPIISSQNVETEVLLKFKGELHDPMSHLKNWNAYRSPCKYSGVLCDSKTGQIIGLSLSNLSLSGKLSPSISLLQNLTILNLSSNAISGPVPSEFSNLTNLQVLNLSMNSLTGTVPDLSTLRNLQELQLWDNNFTGKFPEWVGNLSSLVSLGLGKNNFSAGKIPESIGRLKNLTSLYLLQCNLVGEIPKSIYGLTSLKTLDLSMNQISGGILKDISNLRNLSKIELFQNNLTGNLPPEISNLTMLWEIDISRNRFSGELPSGIGNLKMLSVFQVFQNNFSGELPRGFGTLRNLKAISIYMNRFSGEFPADLGKFSPLNSIDISENKFSGEFPKFLCQNKSLQYLLALDNDFSGEFPDSYAECKSLERFRINQNRFSGKIPSGVWGLPYATIIDFSDNEFTGGISIDIASSTSLTQLYIQNNRLSGHLPKELGELTQLQKLFAFKNSFTGQIPWQFGDLKQLSSLHLERNALTGPIPSELSSCDSLVELNFAENFLSGSIPGLLAQLISLNSLNLSKNKLTGSIPESLQILKLSFIDFSNNNLSGKIPLPLLSTARLEAFSGNAELCVDHGIAVNPRYFGLKFCSFGESHKNASKKHLFLVLPIFLVMMVLLAGIVFVSYQSFRLEERRKKSEFSEEVGKGVKWALRYFHPIELDPKEIVNLEEKKLIACGGSGKVYRLDLNKNGGTFAVKKLQKSEFSKNLTTEIEIMGNIKHRNILKLYASLTAMRANYLVFEFMPNGNLYQALHWEFKGVKAELDWNKRYKIAVGAAKAIMYLHHDCSPAIIHRDIKSTNILLDKEYEAKVADFGISKIAEESESSCFVGTHGYIAPELAYTAKATEKSDVYSFGVVLLELLTGCSPSDSQLVGKDIVCWVSSNLDRKNLANVLDLKLFGTAEEVMAKVMKIALQCTNKVPSTRPTMREVVKMLIDAEPQVANKGRKKQVRNASLLF